MILHADAVAEDGAARVRRCGIHRDDTDGPIFFSIVVRQLIDQRALAGTRSTSQADYAGFAGVREQSLEQVEGAGRAVFDGGDGAGQRSCITGAQALNQGLGIVVQTDQCKAATGDLEPAFLRRSEL
jgi:hypothetical protein